MAADATEACLNNIPNSVVVALKLILQLLLLRPNVQIALSNWKNGKRIYFKRYKLPSKTVTSDEQWILTTLAYGYLGFPAIFQFQVFK